MEELIKAFELLRDNCKEDNCLPEKCPFCFHDWDNHCKLGSNKQMYPNEWGDANKE